MRNPVHNFSHEWRKITFNYHYFIAPFSFFIFYDEVCWILQSLKKSILVKLSKSARLYRVDIFELHIQPFFNNWPLWLLKCLLFQYSQAFPYEQTTYCFGLQYNFNNSNNFKVDFRMFLLLQYTKQTLNWIQSQISVCIQTGRRQTLSFAYLHTMVMFLQWCLAVLFFSLQLTLLG